MVRKSEKNRQSKKKYEWKSKIKILLKYKNLTDFKMYLYSMKYDKEKKMLKLFSNENYIFFDSKMKFLTVLKKKRVKSVKNIKVSHIHRMVTVLFLWEKDEIQNHTNFIYI